MSTESESDETQSAEESTSSGAAKPGFFSIPSAAVLTPLLLTGLYVILSFGLKHSDTSSDLGGSSSLSRTDGHRLVIDSMLTGAERKLAKLGHTLTVEEVRRDLEQAIKGIAPFANSEPEAMTEELQKRLNALEAWLVENEGTEGGENN
ncbi:MAG: hypothetical protein AAGC68_02770 [Verrucomicrobiota bacterium]